VARFGLRAVLSGGMLVATAGLLLFTGVRPGGSYIAEVLPGGILSGLGMGLSLVSGTVAAVQGVPPQQSGLASRLLHTSRLVGGALGLAVRSTIATSYARNHVAAGQLTALTDGFGIAFAIGAGFTLVGALAAATLLRPQRARLAEVPAAEREPEPAGD